VHVSTDYVFDGSGSKPYRPEDPAGPVSVYGKTKRAGELAVTANCSGFVVVRTAWLYGPHGKNFVATMLRLAGEHSELRVVDDQIGSPTYTGDLAAVLCDLVASGATGTVHATNAGICSWHGFACEIIKQAGKNTPVVPVSTAEFPRPAPRPAYSVLDCSRTEEIIGRPIRHWKDGLADYFAAIA
jgi:dTDP-4-dehydrorhamnose reductase